MRAVLSEELNVVTGAIQGSAWLPVHVRMRQTRLPLAVVNEVFTSSVEG